MLAWTLVVASVSGGWGDLLTKPASAWDARLGAGKGGAVSKGAGDFSLRTRHYGAMEVTFLGGRPSSVEVALPARPELTWTKALSAAGLSPKGATARSVGKRQTAEMTSEQTLLRLPGLPKGTEVSFVRRRVGGRVTEQMVGVSVPAPVRLMPDAAERKGILDATRDEVLKATKQKVIFRVTNLRMGDDWAFLAAEPRTPRDGKADWSKLAPAGFEAGAYDPVSFALLRREGGRWRVRALALGPTDVAWEPWAKEFGAPCGLFSDRRL